MEYEEFKYKVLAGLQEIYGANAAVRAYRALKNNGKHYDSILIELSEVEGICQIVPLEWFYQIYCEKDMSLEGCIKTVYRISEGNREMSGVFKALRKAAYWGEVRKSVYPILLSTKENQEILERAVSTSVLDMSVVYIIRGEIGGRCIGVQIDHERLEAYGISVEQLHAQAMENLMDDGYRFWDICSFVASLGYQVPDVSDWKGIGRVEESYILTNETNFYGAAGILNKKLVREFANGRNFFILPSSINETIFVSAGEERDMEIYNCMVRAVNETELDVEERLTDHVYFYDAVADEIRVCA